MNKLRRAAVVLLSLITSLVIVPVAFAHPLGNFTINHYAGLQIGRNSIALDFVLDMAEIPAFQEIATFDANGNGQPDPEETAKYHPAQCEALRPQMALLFNGQPLSLHLDSSSVAFPPGAGGLPTLRLTCEFSAPISFTDQKAHLAFADNSYADRIGWREIVVTADGLSLQGTYASASISRRLTAYPKDMLSDPLNQRQLSIDVLPVAGLSTASTTASPAKSLGSSFSLGRSNDAFTQLITAPITTPVGLLFALLVAFVWGGLHAVTPGHGKTIVGAYLVGSRGTARHALFLGLTTTITHTAGVFALGLITLFAARFIVPEKLYPWLSLLSGLLVALIGFWMLFVRLRAVRRPGSASVNREEQELHEQHDHDHTHTELIFEHAHPHHDHGYIRAGLPHSHGGHEHTHDAASHHAHEHAHGSHVHSHLPPGASGEAVTWRSILALGISGGILPCPSALIVLLSAIALGRIALGLVLVLAFSAGLAGVLSGIGILFVYAGRLFQLSPKQGILLRLMPLGSALVIAGAGLLVAYQALAQIGWLRL